MSEVAIELSEKAKELAKNCGTWAAARFLAKRGVSLQDALAILLPGKYAAK